MTSAKTVIGDAGPRGRGVFAAARILSSTPIGSFSGRARWIWDIPRDVWPYTIQVDYDRYVVPRRGGAIWYFNHSCEPNCVISGESIVAWRDIDRGEELTFDYATDVDWPGFSMDCSCGSKKCRKVIRAYRFLPAGTKRRYGRHVAPFILRAYFRRRRVRSPGPAVPLAERGSPRAP